MKIGLIGSPGTGKSTIANNVSSKVGLNVLLSKTVTRDILNKYNYEYSPNNFVELFLSEPERQRELIERRIEMEGKYSDFITDRTSLDHFAYALLGIEKYNLNDISEFFDICFENMKNYTHLFYVKRRDNNLVDNQLRTVNIWFQKKIDFIIEGLIRDWNIKCENVESGQWEYIVNNL